MDCEACLKLRKQLNALEIAAQEIEAESKAKDSIIKKLHAEITEERQLREHLQVLLDRCNRIRSQL